MLHSAGVFRFVQTTGRDLGDASTSNDGKDNDHEADEIKAITQWDVPLNKIDNCHDDNNETDKA